MSPVKFLAVMLGVAAATALAAVSCSSNDKKDANGQNVTTNGSEAGGTAEQTYTESATVTAIDPATRRITLHTADGQDASFTAGPEVRNFDQIHVGDRVTAKVTEKLTVFVRGSNGQPPSVTHAAELATAPKGAKPGLMTSQSYEVVAIVTAIDSVTRMATLQFSDASTRGIRVRDDVDLSRYKVGDSVVIRIADSVSVVVETP
jgi:Cu/Ag efflux protein CusF